MVIETIQPAYKKTEIGPIPEDWKEFTLDSLCRSFTKQTGFDYSAYIKPKLVTTFKKGTIPFIQNKDFYAKSINFNTDYYIPEEVANLFPRILLDENCLLISISGSIGNVGIFSNVQKAFLGGAVAVAKFRNKKQLDWVMYYLLSHTGQNALLKQVKAGAQHNLILDDLRKITIPVPSENEQQRITQILSETDELLKQLDKLIEKKKKIKQGALQELLIGRKRLKGEWIHQKTKKLTEVGVIPEDWQVSMLKELCNVDTDNLPANTSPDYEFDYISLEDINRGKLNETKKLKFKDAPSRARRKIVKDDILIATVRPNLQNHFFVKTSVKDYVCSTGFSVLRCRDKISAPFLYYQLFGYIVSEQIMKMVIGSNYPSINKSDIMKIRIPIPEEYKEQRLIAQTLSNMDSEVEALEQKRDKYRQLKIGMMQQLLTGRIRLKWKN
jgi:type I restriction enzyme S subunit